MSRTRGGKIKRVLVAGAAGALGHELTRHLLTAGYRVRAIIHNTPLDLPGASGVECVHGSVADFDFLRRSLQGVDAVCQLATTKEDPQGFFDVSLRGTYNLLEAARQCSSLACWILCGGDAAMGIYYYPQAAPISETMPHRAYPGCYAFSKVIEEVMGEQFHIQYGLPYVCLRSSWIMHRDMILRTLLARNWAKHLTAAQKKTLKDGRERAAIIVHPDGTPLIRHVVSIHDVVAAFLLALSSPAAVGQTFNIAAASAFSYDTAAKYLASKSGMQTMRITVPEAHDFQIDISKARAVLGYRPRHDIFQMIDAAWEYRQQSLH